MTTLSTRDWIEYDSANPNKPMGAISWNYDRDLTIPPLPTLDDTDLQAVKNYIIALAKVMATVEELPVTFRIVGDGFSPKVEVETRLQGQDDYEVKGLVEWEIREIANRKDFLKYPVNEFLLGQLLD